MEKQLHTYNETIKGLYPGYQAKGYNEAEKKLKELNDHVKRWADRVERERNKGFSPIDMEEANDGLAKAIQERDDFKKVLDSGAVFTDQSVERSNFIEDALPLSLGDINGRAYVDKNNIRIPMPLYNITTCAEELGENDKSTAQPLTDMIGLFEGDNAGYLSAETVTGPSVKADDKKTIEKATDYTHDVLFINAENKKAFELLVGGKDPLTFSSDTVIDNINAHLCGKAKRNAVIITNNDGFANLDTTDANGRALIKKIDGKFIFMDKYEVQEFDNDILPNAEGGKAPIIIGDMSIVKFFILREDALEKEDFFTMKNYSKDLRKEIVKLSTTSDKAYIHGVIA